MRTTLQAAILAMAASAVAACDRPLQNATAYNNSGRTAAVAGTSAPTPEPGFDERSTAPANAPAAGAASDPDTRTSAKILSEITAASGMKDADVNVTTTNGAVTLGGTAHSQDQVALALDIAKRQPGVAAVQSDIQVQ